MASLPSRDMVLDELPEMAEFRPIMLEAWQRWQDEIDPATKIDLTDSTRAFAVHNFIVAGAAKRLDGVAITHNKAKLRLFAIRNYLIRFKKHDADLISSNVETRQVKRFMSQMPLSGIPTMFNLEAGYVLDALGTKIVSTNLVCPNGFKNQPYWHIELHDDGYELSEVVDLFDSPDAGAAAVDTEEQGSRWRRRDSGVIIPFARKKPR